MLRNNFLQMMLEEITGNASDQILLVDQTLILQVTNFYGKLASKQLFFSFTDWSPSQPHPTCAAFNVPELGFRSDCYYLAEFPSQFQSFLIKFLNLNSINDQKRPFCFLHPNDPNKWGFCDCCSVKRYETLPIDVLDARKSGNCTEEVYPYFDYETKKCSQRSESPIKSRKCWVK